MSDPQPDPAPPPAPPVPAPTGTSALPAAPPTSTGPDDDEPGGGHRLLLIGIAVGVPVLIGAVLILLLPLLRRSTPTDAGPGGTQDDLLQQAQQMLARDTDVNSIKSALRLINAHVNSHPELRPPTWTDYEREPGKYPEAVRREEVKTIVGLSDADLAETETGTYTTLDAQYLDGCFLCRDVVRSMEPGGLPGAVRTPTPQRVRAAFAWSVREVRLQGHAVYTTPPQYAMRRGWGTDLERALVFLELLRQIGEPGEVTGCLVFCPGDRSRSRFWACGAVIGDDPNLYLFDPALGVPLPGRGGRPGTLAEACADGPGNPLRRLDLGTKREEQYNVTAEQARSAKVRQVVPLSAVAPRLRHLQERLLRPPRPEERVTLFADVRRDHDRLTKAAQAAGLKDAVQPWTETDDNDQVLAGATVLRRFLPADEGGTDVPHPIPIGNAFPELADRRNPGYSMPLPTFQFYTYEIVSWNALPLVFRKFPSNIGLGERVRSLFAAYWLGPILEPRKARDLMLRGRYADAIPLLTSDAEALRGQLRREEDEKKELARRGKTLDQEVETWANDRAMPAYIELERLREAQKHGLATNEDVAAAREQVTEAWRQGISVGVLLNASVARGRLPEVVYWQGLCKQEQAEVLQTRVDRAGSQADADDVQAARSAWRDARGVWVGYKANHPNGPDQAGVRRMLARARLLCDDPADPDARRAAALAELDDLAATGRTTDRIAAAHEARRLRTDRRWWGGAGEP